MFKLQKVKRNKACHPQSNGQTKVVNKCVENYLRCMAFRKCVPLPLVEWWYDTTFQNAIGRNPYEVMCGQTSSLNILYV